MDVCGTVCSTGLSEIFFAQMFRKYRAKCGKQHKKFLACSASCFCPILTKQDYVIALVFNVTKIPSVFCRMPTEHRIKTADALHSRTHSLMHARTHQHNSSRSCTMHFTCLLPTPPVCSARLCRSSAAPLRVNFAVLS